MDSVLSPVSPNRLYQELESSSLVCLMPLMLLTAEIIQIITANTAIAITALTATMAPLSIDNPSFHLVSTLLCDILVFFSTGFIRSFFLDLFTARGKKDKLNTTNLKG
jgi:hypothetical protein